MRDKRLDNRPIPPEEMLLIRAGHHLWRSSKRKEWPEPAISNALQAVWDAKEALRVELRKEWLDSYEIRVDQARRRNFGRSK